MDPRAPGEPARVLVIEDDPSLRAVLLELLEREDYRVVVATHAREAVRLAQSQQPQAIVLDAGQPGPSTWAALQQLGASDRTRHIPVIALSDQSEPPVQVVSHWPNVLLAKPFDVFVLLEHVARAVERKTSDGGPTLEAADAR